MNTTRNNSVNFKQKSEITMIISYTQELSPPDDETKNRVNFKTKK